MAMNADDTVENIDGIRCAKCDVLLEPRKVNITYLRSTFPVKLLRCPKCGQTLMPENTALTKAVEVEMTLEEK